MVLESESHGILQNRSNQKVDFAKPEQWEIWIRRFKHFKIASGLKSKTDQHYKADLLQSFKILDADATKYDKVLQYFEDHFSKSRNTIHE